MMVGMASLEAEPVVRFYAYNLGSRCGTSILELIRMFERVTGAKIVEIKAGPARPGDPAWLVASPYKFMDEHNFKYRQNMEAAIKSAWEQYNAV